MEKLNDAIAQWKKAYEDLQQLHAAATAAAAATPPPAADTAEHEKQIATLNDAIAQWKKAYEDLHAQAQQQSLTAAQHAKDLEEARGVNARWGEFHATQSQTVSQLQAAVRAAKAALATVELPADPSGSTASTPAL